MLLDVVLARPRAAAASAVISARRDWLRTAIWGAALALAAAAALLRPAALDRAAAATWAPFLTLAAVIGAGLALDAAGLLRAAARLLMPASAPRGLAIAGCLGFTALLSGLVNLDVAVVVAVPLILVVARQRGLPAGRLAVAAALTANATSFLLPTSNLTTLLVLDHAPAAAAAYVGSAWLAWLLVTVMTVGVLSAFVAAGTARPREGGDAGRGSTRPPAAARAAPPRTTPRQAGLALLDLVPMFIAAVGIRALLNGGVVLAGGLAARLAMASGLAAGADNLPAAAAVSAAGHGSAWAAVLGLALGPDLLLTGSVASLISRRIARDHGARFGALRYSLVGAALLPLQLLLAVAGLHLTGAL